MKRTRKPFNLNPLIQAILIVCTILSLWVALSTRRANKELREENKRLVERMAKLPEAFGGVGYISAISRDELYIEVVGYGRFLITPDESQFLQVGDKAPQYILERGQ
ncbi:hypothetical protein [Streptococcus jiangjianxini]|uniref:hypothetical protein n=1 Tax=Streptococcus jiangjianxini TaxID=3161189 RepID=UPI0032EB3F1D